MQRQADARARNQGNGRGRNGVQDGWKRVDNSEQAERPEAAASDGEGQVQSD